MSAGLEVGTEKVTAAPKRRGLTPAVWALIALAAILLASTLRVVTGANDIDSSGLLIAAFGLSVPIALAGLGGLWSERAGVVNIGLEGMMVLGTWGAAFVGYHMGPWMGLVGAVVGGVIGGLVHALATVTFGVDHIVSGVALNILALGVAKYLAVRFFAPLPGGGPTQSPPLETLPSVSVPGLSPFLFDTRAEALVLHLRRRRHPAGPVHEHERRDGADDRPLHRAPSGSCGGPRSDSACARWASRQWPQSPWAST